MCQIIGSGNRSPAVEWSLGLAVLFDIFVLCELESFMSCSIEKDASKYQVLSFRWHRLCFVFNCRTSDIMWSVFTP